MKYALKTYNGKPADFYIQCKGLNSGRPLEKPIPNCFSVYTSDPNLYNIVLVLFIGKHFEPFLRGSVIPFIIKSELETVICSGIEKFNPEHFSKLEQIGNIDRLLIANTQKNILLKKLRIALAREIFGNVCIESRQMLLKYAN